MRLIPPAWLALALAGLVACTTPPPPQPTPAPTLTLPTKHVTAEQLAQSMHNDSFFDEYGETMLLIQGTVSAIEERGNRTRLTLATGLPLTVVCDTASPPPALRVGEVITVRLAHPRNDASRDASAVLLTNCSLVELVQARGRQR